MPESVCYHARREEGKERGLLGVSERTVIGAKTRRQRKEKDQGEGRKQKEVRQRRKGKW